MTESSAVGQLAVVAALLAVIVALTAAGIATDRAARPSSAARVTVLRTGRRWRRRWSWSVRVGPVALAGHAWTRVGARGEEARALALLDDSAGIDMPSGVRSAGSSRAVTARQRGAARPCREVAR